MARTYRSALVRLLVCASTTTGAVGAVGAGCGDAEGKSPDKAPGIDGGPAADPCAGADAGSACGPNQHCVDARCIPNYCGDGVMAGDEQCDDGNLLTGDGCSPSCRSVPLTCGDAVVQEGEQCDDGNDYEYDDCSTACTINQCGNAREDAFEECDDGNLVNDDDCSNTCRENRCGNGRVDVGEECDDANQTQDDGTWIYQEDGSRNHGDVCSNSCIEIRCGNGRVEGALLGGQEECDDGNDNPDDNCSNSCRKTGCGNGILEPGEACETAACVKLDGTVCPSHTLRERCNADCTGYVADTACAQCLETHCRDYDGMDAVADCIEKEDPRWVEHCEDLVSCNRSSGSGFDAASTGPIQSFCGTADPGLECAQAPGGVINANGPCRREWAVATNQCESTDACDDSTLPNKLVTILGDATSPLVPAGAAFNLTLCITLSCMDACGPGRPTN